MLITCCLFSRAVNAGKIVTAPLSMACVILDTRELYGPCWLSTDQSEEMGPSIVDDPISATYRTRVTDTANELCMDPITF